MGAVGSSSQKKGTRLWGVILIIAVGVVFGGYSSESPESLDNYPSLAYARTDKSDMDGDGDIDLDDLILFSVDLGLDWETVDWCQWIEDNAKKEKRFKGLFDFIRQYYRCDQPPEDPLAIKNQLLFPTRVAFGSDGKLYVSDAKVGSVFIYEIDLNTLNLIGELKGLNRPLGVAVDSQGRIYVGNDGSNNVERYSPTGMKETTIGEGIVEMPNDMAVDRMDRLYVVDSLTNKVWVFNPDGTPAGSIGAAGEGDGQFRFPIAITVAYHLDGGGVEVGEVYVADQGHYRVQVFSLQGNFLRSFGEMVSQGMGGWKWMGKFVTIQSLAVDHLGRIHAADSYMNNVQILDTNDGSYVDSYGSYGMELGKLNLPLDIAINGYGQVVVANAENHRVEIIYTVP